MHTRSPWDNGTQHPLHVQDSIFWNPYALDEFDDSDLPAETLPAIENSIVRGGFGNSAIFDVEPIFRDIAAGDFRLVSGSPGVDWSQSSVGLIEDVFASPRPDSEFSDFGAYEVHSTFPTLCASQDRIEERHSQFHFIADEHTDLDGDGLPEIAGLRLLAEAACQYSTSQGIAAERAFELNMQTADVEPFDTQILRRQHLIAAWMSVSAEAQQTLRDALAETDVVLTGDYAVVECDDLGNCDAVVPGARGATASNTPYSGPGDFDNDGVSNADEWAYIMATGGTMDDFIAAATDPDIRATSAGASGGCFIATAAFGTPMTHELNTLRAFRDRNLLTGTLGAAFADAYYRLSPPAARTLARHVAWRSIVRNALEPVVKATNWLMVRDRSPETKPE